MCDNSKLNNFLAGVIVWVCAISLVALLMIMVLKNKNHRVLPEHVVIELQTDSTMLMSSDNRSQIIDSLNAIMLRREKLLANQYQFVLQKRAFEDSLLSVGSVLIGIVITVLGFFGFKSFQSIEDKAISHAKDVSKNYLENNIYDTVSTLMNQRLLKEITRTTSDFLKDGIVREVNENIELLNEKINQLNKFESSVSSDNKLKPSDQNNRNLFEEYEEDC